MQFTLHLFTSEQADAIRRDPATLVAVAMDMHGKNSLYIDKDWQAIHYLFTQHAEPVAGALSSSIFEGEGIGDDLGYGPARLLTPTEVKQIAAALARVTKAKVMARYDAAKMDAANIYPEIWVRDGKEARDEVISTYGQFVSFYRHAAETGDFVLLVLA
ncbi:MAG TPA: YfbM family protein [Opitutaceae bacterium]|jgi:hypothetical protein